MKEVCCHAERWYFHGKIFYFFGSVAFSAALSFEHSISQKKFSLEISFTHKKQAQEYGLVIIFKIFSALPCFNPSISYKNFSLALLKVLKTIHKFCKYGRILVVIFLKKFFSRKFSPVNPILGIKIPLFLLVAIGSEPSLQQT